jgi:hypothetical protein
MGLFSKKSDDGKIKAKGMGGAFSMNPAVIGGPSTEALSPDDPLLQPVNGVSLEMYGTAAGQAQARGITDEAGMCALIEEMYGVPASDVAPALQEWVRRMGQSMVVGQQLRKYMGY